MKSNRYYIVFLSSALLLAGCKQQNFQNRQEVASPVSVSGLTYGSIKKTYNTTSTAIANAEVELKSEMAGLYRLQKNPRTGAPYKLGDKVKAGDLIVRIEDRSYENGISIETKRINLEIAEQDEIKQKNLYDKGGATMTDIRNSEVKIIGARIDYENAQMNLEKMNIRAPFDGVIVNLPHYSDKTQTPSGSSIVSIMDYSTLLLDINLPESAINEIKVGMPALITHYTIPNDTIQGMITELSPAISAETRTFKGKLVVDNSNLLIRPGMFVKADIVTESSDSTVIVPKNIVRTNNKNKMLYVVEQGYARQRYVTVGLEDKYYVEIKNGLEADDQIVTRGYETLRNGNKVKIQK